jgi:hypothetical protein
LPFADFNFVNNCFGSSTEFLSASTGNLSNFQWEILDTEGNLLASFEDVTQVSFDFPGIGTFRVIHIVEDVEGNRRQATRLVEIVANGIGEMLLFEDVLGLAASIPNLSYRWFKDGVEIPGATERFFNPTESGLYAVEGSNGTCSVRSEEFEFVQSIVGLDAGRSPFSFVLYPNPSGNQSRVSWHDAYRGKVTVNIYSHDGKILLSHAVDKDEDQMVCPLNLEYLSRGLYYLELSAGGKSVGMKKMLRQ